MKLFSSPLMFLLGASVAGILLSGCSSVVQENAMLEQARSAFAEAQSDPDVQKNAALELQKAKNDLDQADKSLNEGAEAAEVEHFAYLAKQRTAIAQEVSKVKLAEQTLDAASAERNAVLLQARTREAEQAQQLAEAEKNKALIATEQADASRLQVGAMSAEAEKTRAEALLAAEQRKKLEAQIAELEASKSERGLVITLGDVLFDINKSELRSGTQYTIDKLAAFLAEYPKRNVLIEGFTDSTGTAKYNQGLSERRADAVRNALTSRGVDSRRLKIRGYGIEFPVAGNESAAGRQRNRRVEVIISDDDGQILERKY
ncbi:MAG: OmpA family protein [Desulfuromonadales bacterium]|nr:OmpA family protein [Desulfuromonadales bacterium]